MGLKFNCANAACRARIEVEDALAGAEVPCPQCGTALRAPASHDLKFTCRTEGCGQHLVVDVSEAGRFLKCPGCGQPQRIPGDPPKPVGGEPPAAVVACAKGSVGRSGGVGAEGRAGGRDWSGRVGGWWGWLKVLAEWVFPVAGGALLLSGGLRVMSGWGGSGFAGMGDPLVGVRWGWVMLGFGLVELAIGAVGLLGRRDRLAVGLMAWWGMTLLVYQAGLWWMGWEHPYGSVGQWVTGLGVVPGVAERMQWVLIVLLLGCGVACVGRGPSGRLGASPIPPPAVKGL